MLKLFEIALRPNFWVGFSSNFGPVPVSASENNSSTTKYVGVVNVVVFAP